MIKKIFIHLKFLVTIGLLEITISQVEAASVVNLNNINYTVNEVGMTATVNGPSSSSTSITDFVIPDFIYYNGSEFPVTSIRNGAFEYRSDVTSVTIGNSVTSIGDWAFMDCSGLTSVTIGNSVTSIGRSAFYGCNSLTKVEISDLGAWCNVDFEYDMRRPVMSSNPFLYADHLFLNGEEVKDLKIPDNISVIKSYAFLGCNKLTSVEIPNSVTSIGSNAFSGCSGLTSVTIPNSVTSIGNGAFSGCYSLTKVEISDLEAWCGIDFSDITSNPIGYAHHLFLNGEEVKDLKIPNSVTSIGSNAFSGCSGLTSVTIPNSVTSIGNGAFSSCSGLTSVTIPNSVTSIGNYAFSGCSNIKNLRFENGESELDLGYNFALDNSTGLFSDCPIETLYLGRNLSYNRSDFSLIYNNKTLKEVTIGSSVTSIRNGILYGTFYGCTALTDVRFEDGESVLKVGYNERGKGLFYDCPIETLYLGRDLSYVNDWDNGYSPFYGNETLKEVLIGNSVASIGNEAFCGCSGLTSLTIGNSVTSIGNDAFSDCSGLTSVTIPNSVASIGSKAFYGCSGLTSVMIGNSVKEIGDRAFFGCSGLTSVTIPNSVTSIGNGAFYDCSGLTSVTIPNSVTSIGDRAFHDCSRIKNLIFEDGESVLTLGLNGLFSGCPIETVYLGRTLSYISSFSYHESPFSYIETLTNVTISNSVTSIGDHAFYGCSGLTSVTIPNSVTSIGDRSFSSCSGLTSVRLPKSITSYGYDVFSDCLNIQSVVFEGLGTHSFPESVLKNAIVYYEDADYLPNSTSDFNGKFEQVLCNLEEIIYTPLYRNVSKLWSNWRYDLLDLNCFEITDLKYCQNTLNNEGTFLIPFNKKITIKYKGEKELLAVFFRGKDITDEVMSEEGFSFLPSISAIENEIKIGYKETREYKYVDVSSPGNLFSLLNMEDISNLKYLKIKGDINGSDIIAINRLENLRFLDLKEANIVAGGSNYYEYYYASDDVIGSYFINNLSYLSGIILPSSVKAINSNAFSATNLSDISIGENTDFIYEGAFQNTEITSLAIPRSVKLIDINAFNKCTKLRQLVFEDGESILNLGYSKPKDKLLPLFQDCPIDNLYIGRQLDYAVDPFGKTIYQTVTLAENAEKFTLPKDGRIRRLLMLNPTPPDNNLNLDVTDCILMVPNGSLSAYLDSEEWNIFPYIVEIDGSISHVGGGDKDDEAGIDEIYENNDNGPYYDNECVNIFSIQGTCIKRNGTQADIESLSPGIYIINGRKIMIK